MTDMMVIRDWDRKPVGIAQGVTTVQKMFYTSVSAYRIMFHTTTLGYGIVGAGDDFMERLQDDCFWIDGERLMIYQVEIVSQSESALILEGVKLCKDTGPSRVVPASWMAL